MNSYLKGKTSSAASSETSDKNNNDGLDTLETIPDAVPVVLTEPPIEDQLAWHTLWPESHKLYGHGNELFSLCCDHQGKLVASSCKVFMLDFLYLRSTPLYCCLSVCLNDVTITF